MHMRKQALLASVDPYPLWRVGWPDNGDPQGLAAYMLAEDCASAAQTAIRINMLKLKAGKLAELQAQLEGLQNAG